MSGTPLTNAMVARLNGTEVFTGSYPNATTAQARLVALLNTVPSGSPPVNKPAVLYANMADLQRLVYPCITLRPSIDRPDGRFADGVKMDDDYYDIEVWDKSHSSQTIGDICQLVTMLLDRKFAIAPALLLPDRNGLSGWVYWMEQAFGPHIIPWPKAGPAWCGLMQFRIVNAAWANGQ